MAIEVTDGLIRQLTREWVATLTDQYPEPARPHRFSLQFHWKMRPILRQAGKLEAEPVRYRGARFAAALLVAALLTATVAMAVPVVRERVYQMVWEVYEKYSRIHYEPADGGDDEDADFGEFVCYYITYIPEGFTLLEDRTTEISHRTHYENEQGVILDFDQVRIDRDAFDIDTEDDEPVRIMLNGNQPAWYLANRTLQVIFWDDGTYSFSVATTLSKEESIKVAESAAPK